MGQVTLWFTHMVEDRDATHEGTLIEDKPPAAEGEEASEAAAKKQCPGPRGGASSAREAKKGWGLTSQGVWKGKDHK